MLDTSLSMDLSALTSHPLFNASLASPGRVRLSQTDPSYYGGAEGGGVAQHLSGEGALGSSRIFLDSSDRALHPAAGSPSSRSYVGGGYGSGAYHQAPHPTGSPGLGGAGGKITGGPAGRGRYRTMSVLEATENVGRAFGGQRRAPALSDLRHRFSMLQQRCQQQPGKTTDASTIFRRRLEAGANRN
eukprot:g5697.t1